MSTTLTDWYRMIWQFHIKIIVCLVTLDNLDDCVTYFNFKNGGKTKVIKISKFR